MSFKALRVTDSSLRDKVLDTFNEYGGWWLLSGMAEWLNVSEKRLRKMWAQLEVEGLMERKRGR